MLHGGLPAFWAAVGGGAHVVSATGAGAGLQRAAFEPSGDSCDGGNEREQAGEAPAGYGYAGERDGRSVVDYAVGLALGEAGDSAFEGEAHCVRDIGGGLGDDWFALWNYDAGEQVVVAGPL